MFIEPFSITNHFIFNFLANVFELRLLLNGFLGDDVLPPVGPGHRDLVGAAAAVRVLVGTEVLLTSQPLRFSAEPPDVNINYSITNLDLVTFLRTGYLVR